MNWKTWRKKMKRNLIEDAKEFVGEAHKNQIYGKNLPYIVHLYDVYLILCNHDVKDINILVAAWLHDVIEDTTKTYTKIKKAFNFEIAEIVFAVTDELGRNRRERHEKTYPKIQKNEKAIIVKQADRLANIRTGLREGNFMVEMYKKEYPEFKAKLQPYGGLPSLWNELDAILLGD